MPDETDLSEYVPGIRRYNFHSAAGGSEKDLKKRLGGIPIHRRYDYALELHQRRFSRWESDQAEGSRGSYKVCLKTLRLRRKLARPGIEDDIRKDGQSRSKQGRAMLAKEFTKAVAGDKGAAQNSTIGEVAGPGER